MLPLPLGLTFALLALELLLVVLARALRRPLGWRVIALGLVLPLLSLAPWLDGVPLFVPTGVLDGQVPGTVEDPRSDPRAEGLNDVALLFVAWELEVRHALSEGRLPLWSDLIDGGSSPWLNPQAGVLSPIALAARAVPIQHHFLVAFALKMLIAFQGTWLLARFLGLRSASAIFAGVAVALGGPIVCWAMFPHGAVVAWTPWLAAGAIRVVRRRQLRAVAATAVLAACALLSGQPEVALAAAVFAGLCALWAKRRSENLLPFVRLTLACALGLALAAPHLVPFAMNLSGTIRAQELVSEPTLALAEAPLSIAHPKGWFRDGQGGYFVAAASPRAFGWPYGERFRGPIHWIIASQPFVGVAAWAGLFLALGIEGWRRRSSLRFVLLGFALVLLAARFIPLDRWVREIPLLRLAETTRFLPLAGLAFALAAALGWEALFRRRVRQKASFGARVCIALGLAALSSLALDRGGAAIALWLGIVALAGWVLARPVAVRRFVPAGLLILLALDLIPWGRAFQPRGDGMWFFPRTQELEALVRTVHAADGPWRATGNDRLVYPSILPAYGIAEIRASDPSASASYVAVLDAAFGYRPSIRHYFSSIRNLEHPLLDFLNVRAVLSNAYLPTLRGFEEVAGARPPFVVLRNPDALPRAFLARRVVPVAPERRADWIAAMTDPWTVSVDPDVLSKPMVQRSAARDVVHCEPWERTAPGRFCFRVAGHGRRLLATSLPYPAGWRATSRGQVLERVVIHGAFLGVWVPNGTADVALRYEPPGFRLGWSLFGLAVLGLTLVGLARARHRPVLTSRA